MITKNKIIDIWKTQGWTDAAKYHNDLTNKIYPKLDILHPDKVSPKAFWKASEKLFNNDTVCNTQFDNSHLLNKTKANAINHLIPLFSGMIGFMEWAVCNVHQKFGSANIAEIGCGYGSFYENFIKNRKDVMYVDYTGFDIVKRFEQAVEVKGKDGTFTKKQIEQYKDKFNIFYSCNVFQHLSPKKIEKYLKQMFEMLPVGGYAVLSYVKDAKTSYHYGQVVEIIPLENFYKLCEVTGFTIECKTEQSVSGNKSFNLVSVFLTKLSK